MFTDPHEIANVFGLRGVRLMHDEAADAAREHLDADALLRAVRAGAGDDGLRDAGPRTWPRRMGWPGIIGLGEMMNFPGVVNGSQQMLAEIAETQKVGKTVGGHYASPDLGPAFHAYAAGGPADDHEGDMRGRCLWRGCVRGCGR